ncbi:ABC transporter substrate-binding protein [Ottowia sp. GY511]|uniref:ABC transporter substrate-binding protein n=1 Tax=Ottowia flava TaxID=2675430 RepID=A0ABW4KSJ4_9BURK|nr:ABC transporter substrate-binding protein [Ottowia sp. GY511]
MKLSPSLLALSAACLAAGAQAQISDDKIKIGVLTDMSGIFSDFSGRGSVEAAKMAVEKLGGKIAGKPVEVVFADHQNKPDVGLAIARKWFDTEGVDAIVDIPQTAIALAVVNLAVERNKAVLLSSAASSDLSGSKCTPNHVMWTHDSWAYTNTVGRQMVKEGGDTWFVLAADYVFGKVLTNDLTSAVNKAGGKMVGTVAHPVGTNDFSSFLLQAQSSKAKVIALGNSGADAANAVKQATEFGLTQGGKQRLAGLFMTLPDIHSLGTKLTQGMYLSTTFYWDKNDSTRAFTKQISARNKGIYPDAPQAGVYSAVLHYAKAIESEKTDAGDKVIAAMKKIPTDDPLFGPGRVREDGRKIHPVYLMQVKTPKESTGPYDVYKTVAVTPAEEAFQPLAESACPLVKK